MRRYHLAQVNLARMKAPFEDPMMADFAARLEEINLLAEGSSGFVWRLVASAAYLRPFEDDRIIFNMSVWESVEHLKDFVYRTAHRELIKRRQDWFEKFSGAYTALWWVPVGHVPSVDEAKKRLAHLDVHGPTEFAFNFQKFFPPDEQFQRGIDWGAFQPCPALGKP